MNIAQVWKAAYPEAHAGILVMRGAANPTQHAGLDKRKTDLETELRARFSGFDRPALLRLPELRAYDEYYRRFKKTYHIQLQLESIVFKGKPIPSVAALVEAMFMAEMEDLLLTAGHDLDVLRLPLTLDAAGGRETYTLLRGETQTLKAGDMYIRDGEGVISSVIYGPDRRTQIRPETKNAVFTAYAPPGITGEAVKNHLEHILRNVKLFAPEAVPETLEVFGER
ncbi:MAG: phenylalanine--tRNA ligase beta subunit-related protein [Anaerolineales bacterium]